MDRQTTTCIDDLLGTRFQTRPTKGDSALQERAGLDFEQGCFRIRSPQMRTDTLSIAEARRVALVAQGLGRPRPKRVGERRVADAIHRMGLLQLDFVNVVMPSHYLVDNRLD